MKKNVDCFWLTAFAQCNACSGIKVCVQTRERMRGSGRERERERKAGRCCLALRLMLLWLLLLLKVIVRPLNAVASQCNSPTADGFRLVWSGQAGPDLKGVLRVHTLGAILAALLTFVAYNRTLDLLMRSGWTGKHTNKHTHTYMHACVCVCLCVANISQLLRLISALIEQYNNNNNNKGKRRAHLKAAPFWLRRRPSLTVFKWLISPPPPTPPAPAHTRIALLVFYAHTGAVRVDVAVHSLSLSPLSFSFSFLAHLFSILTACDEIQSQAQIVQFKRETATNSSVCVCVFVCVNASNNVKRR